MHFKEGSDAHTANINVCVYNLSTVAYYFLF